MDYYEFVFKLASDEDYHKDLLINSLSEAGFDTFEETSEGFNAYIISTDFDQQKLNDALTGYDAMFSFSYEKSLIPQKNWNEVWESNFEPLVINDQCYVRATFHAPMPEFPYEIVIDPKMAFGTGHHQTTTMMMEFILEEDLRYKEVLDMGCGTGILAILAEKCGAKELLAMDYDQVCYDSTVENTQLNQCKNIHVLCGSKEIIPDKKFNIILANINRNILIDQIDRYSKVLATDGLLFMSGFYQEDLPLITAEAAKYNLNYSLHKLMDRWVAVKFVKQN
ncbi:50S ribosomal protein L11 methyltransferase [Desertivirga xinjiangensis]|uniref:50S ribosomal protein L11 methyltransferase n=1 Tax=Desertivirga xinjiangensis TaxID=539206 RepID=UPI00210A22E5|nr:50S ribosomal protein L11 methyltransferase [Pedobacter xinjiangensis]